MGYRLQRSESVKAGIRRIAREQIEKALGELHDDALDRHAAVHQVRKRCKKLRGVVRLVRPVIGKTYKQENARFRDAAGRLATMRDTEALIEAYDKLMDRFEGQVERRAFASVRRALTMRQQQILDEEVDLEERIAAFEAEMQDALDHLESWKFKAGGFKAVAGGLEKTYRRGRKAMAAAYEEPTSERFHEWRKRVKYHWYHTRLLQPVWEPLMGKRRKALSELSDLLGDDHDLAVFRDTVTTEPRGFGSERDVQVFLGLIDRRRAELQAQARPLGERLYAEPPEALRKRVRHYWKVWKSEADLQPALADEVVPGSA